MTDSNTPGRRPVLYDETILDEPEIVDGCRIVLRGERLQVATRDVRGRVARITRRAVSVRRTIEVDVVHEELGIEYEAGDGSDTPAEAPEAIVVLLRAEEVELVKRVRVVEEVRLTKRRVVESRHFAGTVRHEVLDIIDAAS